MNRNKLNGLLSIACLTGFFWLYFNLSEFAHSKQVGVCIIKEVSGVPCPSCGTTRSVMALSQGDIIDAILLNPFGIIVAILMIIIPIWLVHNLLTGSDSMWQFYLKLESFFNQKKIAIPAIALIIANWVWNIYKEL